MLPIADINFWKQKFGLLPIAVDPQNIDSKYLMLNGGHNDFCLQTAIQTAEKEIEKSYFDCSWSTNTKNFVVLNDGTNVQIFNWYDKKTEQFPVKSIEENTDKFYRYLASKSYKTPSDAVPFIIDIFRQLRNISGKQSPVEALNVLFKLLISLKEDYTKIDYHKWNIEDTAVPVQFDYYVDLIRQGVNSISPQLDLILRHISGALFQEAHKEVIYFNSQLELFGGASNKLITKDNSYSSVHYTPQYLARSIVENSLKQIDLTSKTALKIFDPACGSSEFLIETLKQLKNLAFGGKVQVIGWDSSESAVSTSKFLLQYEKRTQWDNGKLDFDVKWVKDSLTEQWDNDYDLIVMNPPFVSWELLKNKDNRDAILDALGSSSERKRPNLAVAFFYKSAKSLNKNGVIGCVLPSTILTSDSYSTIRNQIKGEISLNLIAKLGNYVFEDALTDVCFLVGTKTGLVTLPKLIWNKNEKGIAQDVLRDLRKMESNRQQTVDEKNYSIYTPSIFPNNSDDWKVISLKESQFKRSLDIFRMEGKLSPISDIFQINQGALLGVKNVFKITNDKYTTLSKNEQKFFRPVVVNNSIKCGELKTSEYVWFPYNKDGIIIKNEGDLKVIPFATNVLIPNKDILNKRLGISEWWGLTRPRNWQFEKGMRLYSNRFGNSNSFAIDVSGNCVIEEGNAFIPKKKFDLDDYYFYLACFSSDLFDKLLSIYSKQLAGGNWYDLGAKYTKNIPIPNVHLSAVRESSAYSRLVELGKELEKGNSFVKPVISDILKASFYPSNI
ncbi:hypothetical protein FACS189440_04220 [Bacteroidia bacterium]|nr:hypothetical protein FACS189423_03030 [Bacteroidia bacterium]GHT46367.1 hypothetical protein FACS189440_04220 [Bacteroidia bacterium]